MIKILIIEDEPGIYTFLQEGLTDEGYDTLVATDGSDALRDFADWRPDLVLLDWMLPTMDGIDNDKDVQLTGREFDLLVYFIRHKDRVCPREDIIKDVWGIDFQYDTGVIDVFMNALRRKLHLKTDGCIKTIRGVGFIATDR